MANNVKFKRSSVAGKVPTTGDLDLGEIAINTYDGKLYIKKDNGSESIVQIGAGGGGGGASVTTGVTAPTSPNENDLWWNSQIGSLFIYFDDGSGAQWVQADSYGVQAQTDFTDINYTGTLTGGTGVVNLGNGQLYKDANGNIGIDNNTPVNAGGFATLTIGGQTKNGQIVTAYNNGQYAMNLVSVKASLTANDSSALLSYRSDGSMQWEIGHDGDNSGYGMYIGTPDAQPLSVLVGGYFRQRIESNGAFKTNIEGSSTLYPDYACRAWVNFNGTGTVAIRAGGNVSSITDNGVADYTVNLATAMPDTNYSVNITAGDEGSEAPWNTTFIRMINATSFKVYTGDITSSLVYAVDMPVICVSVFR